jgi:hypothetical protein
MARFAFPAAVVSLFCVLNHSHAQCPSYTHKDSTDVIIGTPSSLPDGWSVYAKPGSNGVFRTNVRTFAETVVSGTSSHSPTNIEISPDGAWLVYLDTRTSNIHVVPSAGGTAISVPYDMLMDPVLGPYMTGFRRGLTSGLEIFFSAIRFRNPGVYGDTSLMLTIPVIFSASNATFGAVKVIANLPLTRIVGTSGSFAIWKDQIFGIFDWAPNGYTMNGFVTIPNNGLGIARDVNIYRFTDSPTEDYWGCGQTMSHDGLYCASNSRNIGDPNCVPNQESTPTYDHKGIYITKFLRAGTDPAVPIDDQIMNSSYGRSINWCPTDYRQGTYDQVEFTNWNFSNRNEYLVCISRGSRISTYGLSYGVWVLHWPDNTWTQVTPATTTTRYDEPALFLTGGIGVQPRSAAQGAVHPAQTARVTLAEAVTLPAGCSALGVYDLGGRCIYTYRRAPAAAPATVMLPPELQSRALLVRFE